MGKWEIGGKYLHRWGALGQRLASLHGVDGVQCEKRVLLGQCLHLHRICCIGKAFLVLLNAFPSKYLRTLLQALRHELVALGNSTRCSFSGLGLGNSGLKQRNLTGSGTVVLLDGLQLLRGSHALGRRGNGNMAQLGKLRRRRADGE